MEAKKKKKKTEPRMVSRVGLGDVVISPSFARAKKDSGTPRLYEATLGDEAAEPGPDYDESRGQAEHVVVQVFLPWEPEEHGCFGSLEPWKNRYETRTVCAYRLAPDGSCDQESCEAVKFVLEHDTFGAEEKPMIQLVGKMEVRVVTNPKLVIGKRIK